MLKYTLWVSISLIILVESKHKIDSFRNANGTKTILVLASRFQPFNTTLGKTDLQSMNCPVSNCIFTKNRSYLKSPHLFDAIVFQVVYDRSLNISKIAESRVPTQQYVFFSNESPECEYFKIRNETNFFNVTMTYRLDSDISIPYGILLNKRTSEVVAPKNHPDWKNPENKFQLDNRTEQLLKEKDRMAAWYVSNCGPSLRRNFATVLKRYMQVDIFGKCGNQKCPKNIPFCEETTLDRHYRFYMAFENCFCKNYVTEKLFKVLNRTIIPVVMGGSDYSKFAPPHSYINVEDFETPKKLADYLIYLSNNFTEYRKYFWWKKYYRVEIPKYACELCKFLNDPARQTIRFPYENIRSWWETEQCRDFKVNLTSFSFNDSSLNN